MTSLNPVLTVGRQIGEVLQVHEGLGRRQAKERAVELLELVGIPSRRAAGRATTRTSCPAACASGS